MRRIRHMLQAIRDEVFKRDGGRCTFADPDGKRCDSEQNLQVDHIITLTKGGDNSPENLRLLCARHTMMEAERVYGKEQMEKHYRRD